MMPNSLTVSILTYNRWPVLGELLAELAQSLPANVEVIVVDNGSEELAGRALVDAFPRVRFVRLPENIGAAGRNAGMYAATGDVVITLDDDVFGLTTSDLSIIITAFEQDSRLGGLCFKTINYHDGQLCNWCHPYDSDRFANAEFDTCEIMEGAVAYRKAVIEEVGGYAEAYFLSNEGPDLACRILDAGYTISYTPRVTLRHRYAPQARASWRRYYYDTRNHFFLAARNFRLRRAVTYVAAKVSIMLVYSLRDGFFRYWLRGVRDGLAALPRLMRERRPMSKETERRIAAMRRHRTPLLKTAWQRLRLRQVRI